MFERNLGIGSLTSAWFWHSISNARVSLFLTGSDRLLSKIWHAITPWQLLRFHQPFQLENHLTLFCHVLLSRWQLTNISPDISFPEDPMCAWRPYIDSTWCIDKLNNFPKLRFRHSRLTNSISLTHLGRVTHICVNRITYWFRQYGLSPGRRQTLIWTVQCCNIVNWTFTNELQWNFNLISNIFIQENAFENVVCEMLSISMCCPFQCVDIVSTVMVRVLASGELVDDNDPRVSGGGGGGGGGGARQRDVPMRQQVRLN